MGTKTVKRLAILIGVIALFGGGGYLLWGFQVGRMAHGVVARAERAEKEGKYEEAEQLYKEHLAVVPDDMEVQLRYAETILKHDKSMKRQGEALTIFEDVMRRYPGREDVRRRAAELACDIGGGLVEKARAYLEILLKTAKDDGHLEYLRAWCFEQDNDFAQAAEFYGRAIEHGSPERLAAALRRAMVLRDKLGKKAEAEKVIDAMVKSAPDDYRAYLGRGRYREGSGGKGSGDDFRKALELAPAEPEVYLEVARAVERESGHDAAVQVLEKGLEATPKSVELYRALANLEERAGRGDRAVEALERALKVMPEELNLRVQLAMLLATRGAAETGRLLLQIAELERAGANRLFAQYLTAYYHFNKRELIKARRILTSMQPDVVRIPDLKSIVNQLLARCYAGMGEVEQHQDAVLRAYSTNPNDPSNRQQWVQVLRSRGDLDGAIRECQVLYGQQRRYGGLLAERLIERNRLLPEAQRQWGEVERLIAEAAAAPAAVEPALLRAEMLMEQKQEAKAYDTLETVRARFPKDARPWTAMSDLLIRQRKFDEAQALLARARQQLGDRVELRLARVRLASARRGPQVVPTLNELARDLQSFSREERRQLLTILALELGRHQDSKGASDAWAQLARDEPQSLQPRLHLFDLALQSNDGKQAEEQIREIEKLDDQYGYFCRAQYLAWQARTMEDPAAKEEARGKARGLLTELRTRRPDLSGTPLLLAMLDEEELAGAGLDEARKREKLESAIALYRRAIELGHRDPAVSRHYIQLLFKAGRGSEALEFYSQMPAVAQVSGDVGRFATQLALANRDYHQAEDIASKAVAANPEDFQARVWLSQVLMEQRRFDEAEAVLRKGVDGAKGQSDRWMTLVRFMVLTRQPAKAEQVVREAEPHMAATPLAMAQYCGIVGKAHELIDPDRARSWYVQARGWFGKAQQALKDPNDLTVRRSLAEFLLQTNEAATAEGPLKELVARTADGKSPALSTWARRSLAQVYATSSPPRTADALALFAGKKGTGDDADDLRVLAMIHEAQGTPEGRRQAIGDLETLIGREAGTPEDRRRLAQLLEAADDWNRAREQYRELILRTDTAADAETLARRPGYITLFVEGLVRHHRRGDDSDLVEARRMIEKLRSIQRDPGTPVLLEAQVDKAANQIDAATKRIRELAARADVTTAGRVSLAIASERMGLFDAAEWIYRRTVDEPPLDRNSLPNRIRLAAYLARHGKVKEAVDLCEAAWADPVLRESTAAVCVQMLCDPSVPVNVAQAGRVAAWIERARGENPRSMTYLVGLGNLYERMGQYPKAEEMYRLAIKINDRDGIASNNLAWLIALKGGKEGEALDLINNAIRARGPLPEYLDTRGMIYLTHGEGRRAITDLEAAWKASPTPPKYFHLAQAYLLLNDKEKARKVLEAGKTRGLPGGLHNLELAQYNKVASALGMH